MPIEWTLSSAKHEVPREEALYAISNATGSQELVGHSGEVTTVYVGHPHAQTDRYIEVIVASRPPNTLVIFHAMPLGNLFQHLT
jgi:hypothetical protein